MEWIKEYQKFKLEIDQQSLTSIPYRELKQRSIFYEAFGLKEDFFADFSRMARLFKSERECLFARIFLLEKLTKNESLPHVTFWKEIYETADEKEQIALLRSLAIIPFSPAMIPIAEMAVRSNLTTVFDAICLQNPFPGHYFSENSWNQMVLKALFSERPLFKIAQLDKRKNQALAQMVFDYAMERWAAKRNVPPELWRMMQQEVPIRKSITDRLSQGSSFEQAASQLLLQDYQLEHQNIYQDWDQLGMAYWKAKPRPQGYQQAGSGYHQINYKPE
ncbi:EboA domain-containing protein [Persicobacter sp. CCB-QB2]|uniref:EboA domain-containing protein n=1 Tax=Persicobacter sp. CCB-QB2 TaxID=1561025 RepID=UPI0006A989FC|nr:EboA domain-containing protein [Persicobacter sp. CCB-QB2]